MLDKKKEKWKLCHVSMWFLLLLVLPIFVKPVLCEGELWDGVFVTESNFLALEAFKQELVDPNGFLRSWNGSGYGACSGGWVGIKCAQGRVIVIQLPWKGLKGHITEKIGQLQGLRKLNLHDNQIGGSIPSSLGLLPNLRGLQLFNNRLTGSIPPSLGSCPLLHSLDISNNILEGIIPNTLANSTKLYRLNLSFNSFSGSVPASLGRLNQLREISLSHNQFSGAIPSAIGRLFRLQTLDFSNNALNGSLPVTLSNLSSLLVLNVENNHLDDQIPLDLGRLHNLSVLKLSRNQFTSLVPASFGSISTLTWLDLSLNNLNGGIPISFDNLHNLIYFNISYNNLSGPVPSLFAQKFDRNSFVGNIQLCGYNLSTSCPSQPPSEGVHPLSPEELKHLHHRKLSTKDVLLIAAGVLLVLAIIYCIMFFCLIRKSAASRKEHGGATGCAAATKTKNRVPPVTGEEEEGSKAGGKLVLFDGAVAFTADDLLCASAEMIGKSTYGTVYKATLEDGSQVAVKRLREKITKRQREFETVAGILGKIRHPNLLALRAYYSGPKGERLLVFTYMPKGSLSDFLRASGPESERAIDWETRKKIAQGMARGLFYLHSHESIIHGNLTSSNVLLDENANAKITDYGLSMLMANVASSNVIATAEALGYKAPELTKLKKANKKTDVYSLGVILLELLTGRSPAEPINGEELPKWVASSVKEGRTNEIFDVELTREESTIGDELLNTLKLALNCVDPAPSVRPEVQLVLHQLTRDC